MSLSTFTVTPGSAITTDSGAPAGAGDTVKLDPEIPHNARLLRDGRLVELKSKPKSRAKATKEAS